MPEFHVVSEYSPAGDQPQAIEKLAEGVAAGLDEQTLLGVTGSGKTYTMANVIERVQNARRSCSHTTKRSPRSFAASSRSSSPTTPSSILCRITTTTSRRRTSRTRIPISKRTPP